MNELKSLTIEEVSLVDAGANPGAQIVLLKRKQDLPEPDAVIKDLKSDKDALVESLIGKLQEHVNKIEDAEAYEVAKKYEILGYKAEELAPQLKSLKQFPEHYQRLIQGFDAALSAVTKAKTFEEVGRNGRLGNSAEIEKVAAEIQKREPKLGWREAMHKAYTLHPELR